MIISQEIGKKGGVEMTVAEPQKLQLEVSHTLAKEQLNGIYQGIYQTMLQAIEDARRDSELDRDLMMSKAECQRFLNVSSDYFEELLAMGLPQGRTLSSRKVVYSKRQIRAWLLENDL